MSASLIPVFSAGQDAPADGEPTDAAVTFESGKKAKVKKPYDYEKSRYKSYRVLIGPEPRTYRFDEKGNPIQPKVKKPPVKKAVKKAPKKTPAKKKKRRAAP